MVAGSRIGVDARGGVGTAAPRRGIRLEADAVPALVRRNRIESSGGAISFGSASGLAPGSTGNCTLGTPDVDHSAGLGFESEICRGTSIFGDGVESGDACGWKAGTSGPTVHASGSVPSNQIWSAAGSPHDVTVDTTVSAAATLTLESCAIVRIAGGKSITVLGQLDAPGAPIEPIGIGALAEESWATLATLGAGSLDFAWTTIANGGRPLNIVPTLTAGSTSGETSTSPRRSSSWLIT